MSGGRLEGLVTDGATKGDLYEIISNTRPNAGLRREGTVLMGTLLTPRLAPSALSSEGTDCVSEDFQTLLRYQTGPVDNHINTFGQ